MSGSSVTSLDDGRKAPFTESVCAEVFDNIETQSSVGITDELERARLEVRCKWFKYQVEIAVGLIHWVNFYLGYAVYIIELGHIFLCILLFIYFCI